MSYLSDFEELNGRYVSFGGNPKGGKISRKGKIKTGKLDFDDVYFVKELKFNLFSFLQMCDKKNIVLFTDTKCLVLSPDFKLSDENQVLLRVPREKNVQCNQSNPSAGVQDQFDAKKAGEESDQLYVLFSVWSIGSTNPQNTDGDVAFNEKEPEFKGRKPESEVNVSPSSSFEDLSDNNINEDNAAGTLVPAVGVHQALKDPSWIEAMQEELLQFKMQKVWVLVDLPHRKRAIGHTQEEGIDYEEVFSPVARIEAIRLFLAYASFMGFMVYQIDFKSAFLYGTIEEEVYVCQPLGFENLDYPDKVYKVVKALYELHQAPRAWYETLASYLLENGFQRGKIDQTLFIKRQKDDILLVQIYVDDIIFGCTYKDLCKAFEKLIKDKFQTSSMGELIFFLGLQVKQKKDGIFISHDKYVAEILRKFDLTKGKSASTPIDTEKPLLKDPDGEDVDVNTYISMIGSLMYLTSSRPDILFAVCACARF
uniref:Putative ribonuclease H-like domain-containing protein n=1 Tax=Tanacetum cinerariifolium TaxID=118510 RepID=A0A6L2JAW6_TANCI|nr:putative ribonuclease H-like domain-containing protein [Tanacetum cinerariifolium]